MKALSMLDHVMLWVARVFAIAASAFVAFMIWGRYTDTDAQLLYKYAHQPIFSDSDLLYFVCCSIWGLIWLLSVWHGPTKVTRTILGITAGYVFVFVLKVTFNRWPYPWLVMANLQAIALISFTLLGTFSMIWIALRPYQKSKISGHLPSNNYTLPQSC